MTDLSNRLREMAVQRETVTPDEHGVRILSAILNRNKRLMAEAADALDARWQTMESAPAGDHNAVVDMWAQGQRYTDCFWGKSTYGGGGYGWVHQGGYDCDGPVMEPVPNPTHWSPLPPPPEDV